MARGVFQATITDSLGSVLPGCQIEVRDEDSGSLVQLYDAFDGGNILGNPMQADSQGFVRFYTDPALYRIVATSGSFSRTWRHVQVGVGTLQDEVDSLIYEGSMDIAELIAQAEADVAEVVANATEHVIAAKSANTERSSSTTNTADPHLSVTLPGTGKWRLEVYLLFGATNSSGVASGDGTQGFKWVLGGTATIANNIPNPGAAYGRANNSAFSQLTSPIVGGLYSTIVTELSDFVKAEMLLDVTGAGTITLNWAQEAAANSTTLAANSYLIATKVAA